MKSAVETLSPTRVRLTVEVPFEELRTNLDTAYREIARQVTIPGFRKGKIPPQIIDRRVGRGVVLEQAVNEAIPQLYVSALQENDVEPLGQPEVDVTNFADAPPGRPRKRNPAASPVSCSPPCPSRDCSRCPTRRRTAAGSSRTRSICRCWRSSPAPG